ncbi:hypothetical protein ABIE13_003634 [Ottowia thiooxydans]|uniref:Uncharacterized protein n=1 Tax=Ottowia thiooxydans TaxID=219182 RepID=A0ABV2QDA5_9BURK
MPTPSWRMRSLKKTNEIERCTSSRPTSISSRSERAGVCGLGLQSLVASLKARLLTKAVLRVDDSARNPLPGQCESLAVGKRLDRLLNTFLVAEA